MRGYSYTKSHAIEVMSKTIVSYYTHIYKAVKHISFTYKKALTFSMLRLLIVSAYTNKILISLWLEIYYIYKVASFGFWWLVWA